MEHNDAIGCQAAVKYVAGELSAEGRDAFEAHFFDCAECAEEVRWEQIFAANVRAISRNEPQRPPRASWWEACQAWFRARPAFALSLAANAVLALGFGYILVHNTRGAGAGARLMATYFAAPPSRAIEQPTEISAGATVFAVHFPRPEQTYPTYVYDILDAGGRRESAGFLKAPASLVGDLFMEVPVGGLRAGVHNLVIRDNLGNDIVARFQFRTLS
jgi:Putative zinc-finger